MGSWWWRPAVASLGVYADTNGSDEAAAPLEAGSAPAVQPVENVAPVEPPAVGPSLFATE